MGEYDQTRPKVRASFRSPNFRGAWDLFFEAMAGASCMSVGASRTGNQTLLRIRVNGKRNELRLETRDLKTAIGTHTVVGELLKRFLMCDRHQLIRGVSLERNMGAAFAAPVLTEARARGVRFLDDCVAFVFEQEIGRRQEEYQLGVAMGEFRTAVRAALDKGASFSDMEDVLKEMAVLTVMES
jgi:hypothetical protein